MRQMLGVGVAFMASAVVINAAASKTQIKRIDEAANVLREIHSAPDKDIPQDSAEQVRRRVPSVKKGAFIVLMASTAKA